MTARKLLPLVDSQTLVGSLKTPLGGLKQLGYIMSLGSGRGSGYWLTPAGSERARFAKGMKR